jgi:short subunit dehydrogenase-like uncharacterized protein
MQREFQVVVWGATGFTGGLVAEVLATRDWGAEPAIRWAIAGRNKAKLETFRDELAQLNPVAAQLELIIADSNDLSSLRAMAARTEVVCSTVGPYSIYGAKLVEACVNEKTDYADLTGETPFIREMIDAHHEQARAQGVRIVHCCGFDSIPSDMGVFFLQKTAMERFGHPMSKVSFYMEKSKGTLSGGTIASMLKIMEDAKKSKVRKVLLNPYALNPDDGVRGPDRGDQNTTRWDEEAGVWTAPFIMAGINTRVVRRSNALMGYPYGEDFSYREVMSLKTGFKGWARATTFNLGLGGFAALAAVGPTRALLKKTLPKPGQGPSREQREAGFFQTRLVGKGEGKRLVVVVRGKRDPGYGATARMLTESVLCLLDRESLPERAGIFITASAMGDALLARLPNADIHLSVVD